MQISPPSAFISMTVPPCGIENPRQAEDLAYQAMTVAAILLVLGSFWVF
jgi:hypothetical protein